MKVYICVFCAVFSNVRRRVPAEERLLQEQRRPTDLRSGGELPGRTACRSGALQRGPMPHKCDNVPQVCRDWSRLGSNPFF